MFWGILYFLLVQVEEPNTLFSPSLAKRAAKLISRIKIEKFTDKFCQHSLFEQYHFLSEYVLIVLPVSNH